MFHYLQLFFTFSIPPHPPSSHFFPFISSFLYIYLIGFHNAKPEFDEVAVIDIDGGGIRSLNYDPMLKTYVIANEVKDENGQKFSQLWTWSGNPTDEPQKISLPNLQHITNVEAVDSITVNGKPQMILMGDEGNASQKITAKYMLVDYSQLGKQ